MIDDPIEVAALMRKMEAHLPIPARATSALVRSLRHSEVKIPSTRHVSIEKVLYMGDEGGIGCTLKVPGQEATAVVVSLAHLRLNTNHPIAHDVHAYQVERTRKLARGL